MYFDLFRVPMKSRIYVDCGDSSVNSACTRARLRSATTIGTEYNSRGKKARLIGYNG